MNYRLLLYTFLVVILLYGCDSPVAKPIQKAEPTSGTASQGYPPPDEKNTNGNGYPAPEMLKIHKPGELPPTPASIPQPQNGKAAISGTIFSFTSQVSIPDTVFYLVPAVEGSKVPGLLVGPDDTQGDIIGRTDSSGSFSLDNVPPGSYYLVVWTPYSWVIAVDLSKDPPLERLINLRVGQREMLGVVQVSWP